MLDWYISVSFGELTLKGKNRHTFEKRAISKILDAISDYKIEEYYQEQGKLYIKADVNDFDEIILYPYLGYIGWHSHKSYCLTEFKKELKNQDIPIHEIKDDELWEACFEKDNKELEDKIFEVCKKEVKSWLRTMKCRRSW